MITTKILKFEASWCGPCRALATVLDKVTTRRSDVEVEKIDIDSASGSSRAQIWGVQSVPTLVFVNAQNGDEVTRLTGLRREDEIDAILDRA